MWEKQYHKPPKNGNSKTTTYKNGDDWGWFMALFYPISIGPPWAAASRAQREARCHAAGLPPSTKARKKCARRAMTCLCVYV